MTFREKYKGVANIEPREGKSVPMVLWSITKECERALDVYEGFSKLYIKEQIEVVVNGKIKKAMFYIMAKAYTNLVAAPFSYYFNAIAKGYAHNGIDLRTLQIAYSECLTQLKDGR